MQPLLVFRAWTLAVWSAAFVFPGVGTGLAQSGAYQPHSSCSPGQLRNDAGQCAPIEQVLAASGAVYWVDQHHAQASDRNPGTQALPWKTISRATRAGVLSPGDAVIVRGGVYREEIRPAVGGRDAARRITFAAYTGETVVVTGADPMNAGWTRNGHAWRHPWRLSLPAYPHKNQPEFRREMVVVDGEVMRAVYSLQDVEPGTFFVAGSDASPNAIYLRLPDDGTPDGHHIEVGTRYLLFGPEDGECGMEGDLGWFRVVGFVFRHAVNRAQWGAVCLGAEGSLMEENTVAWTNGLGIKMSGRNHTMRGNRAVDNGQAGINGSCEGCLLEYNESSRNNWKGYNMFWEAGGGKWSNTRHTTIRHHLAQDNEGPGIWFDRNNADNVVEQSRLINNLGAGLMLEYQTIRTTVRNNVFYGTRWQTWTGSGLLTQASSHNTVVYNSFIANEGTGLWIRPDPGNRAEDGHTLIYNNLFAGNATAASGAEEAREIALAKRTNVLDGNLYWSHRTSETFWYGPERWRGHDLETWQALTRGDAHAQTGDTNRPLVEDLTTPDGWHLLADSPARGRGIPLPAGIEAVEEDIDGGVRPLTGADVGADQYGAFGSLIVPEGHLDSLSVSPFFFGTLRDLNAHNKHVRSPAADVPGTDPPVLPDAVFDAVSYPNPFNAETVIRYKLPEPVHVSLAVYDVTGRRVVLLVDRKQEAGPHDVIFYADNLPNGVYIYRLRAGRFRKSGRMALMR